MRSPLLLCCGVLCVAATWSPARAQDSPPHSAAKPPEISTVLPPQLSAPPSANQLAKRQLTPAPTVATDEAAPRAGVKVAPRTTALPPDAALQAAHAGATASKLAAPLRAQLASDLALAQGMPPARWGEARAAAKPAALTTALPLTEAQGRTHASLEAAKMARTRPRAAPDVGRKPVPLQTGGPAPTALSAEQLAKRARAAAAAAGRPQ